MACRSVEHAKDSHSCPLLQATFDEVIMNVSMADLGYIQFKTNTKIQEIFKNFSFSLHPVLNCYANAKDVEEQFYHRLAVSFSTSHLCPHCQKHQLNGPELEISKVRFSESLKKLNSRASEWVLWVLGIQN
ncbi:hypothetical protein KIL84_011663 [Mauremys mutica]|uniref:Uncharacterized protein n=1 Tax=Mauremys mutica TaxID=74926 RepID=A0A9D4B2I3_9SAUR|nr:hypothetical protein KIL84_011663 [Mauremys mutica]